MSLNKTIDKQLCHEIDSKTEKVQETNKKNIYF
jgi:hypothetical protein